MSHKTPIHVNIKRLTETAIIPQYQSDGAAAFDLHADEADDKYLHPFTYSSRMFNTGIAVSIPDGYVGLIVPRSGLGKKGITLGNSIGVIDSDYRGEIRVSLYNKGDRLHVIKPGDRIAQMLIMPVAHAVFKEVEELDDTERGAGGFGSTGK